MSLPPKKHTVVGLVIRIDPKMLNEFDDIVEFLKEKNPDLKWSRNQAIITAMEDWIEVFKEEMRKRD